MGKVYWTLDVSFNFIYNSVLSNFCFSKYLVPSQDSAREVLAEIHFYSVPSHWQMFTDPELWWYMLLNLSNIKFYANMISVSQFVSCRQPKKQAINLTWVISQVFIVNMLHCILRYYSNLCMEWLRKIIKPNITIPITENKLNLSTLQLQRNTAQELDPSLKCSFQDGFCSYSYCIFLILWHIMCWDYAVTALHTSHCLSMTSFEGISRCK